MGATSITAMELRDRIGDVLNRVLYNGERIVIERRGRPVAAIISMADLEYLERLEDERDAEILRLARELNAQTVSLEEVVKLYEKLHGEPLEVGEQKASA